MSLAVGVFLLALLAAVGWWPSRLLAPGARGAVRAAMAVALGAAAGGLLQVALSALGVPTTATALVWAAGLSLVLGRAFPGAVTRVQVPWPRGVAALLVVVLLVGGLVAVGLPFKGDGGKFWGPRARDLSLAAAAEVPALHDRQALAFHREYPLLAPALLAPAFALSPVDGHAGAKLLLHGLTAAWLVIATWRLLLAGRHGRTLAVLLLTMPCLVSFDLRESLVAGGYVDGLVALFLLLFVLSVDGLRRGEGARPELVMALLMGAALVATKREGAVAVLLVLSAWALSGPSRRGLVAVGAGVALLSVPTLVIRAGVLPDPPSAELSHLVGPALVARLPVVLAGLLAAPLDVTVFGLLPLGLIVVAAMRRGVPEVRGGPWPLGWTPTLVCGLAAFLVLVYCATTMHAERHIDTSLHRLLLQWAPALAVLVAGRPGVPDPEDGDTA